MRLSNRKQCKHWDTHLEIQMQQTLFSLLVASAVSNYWDIALSCPQKKYYKKPEISWEINANYTNLCMQISILQQQAILSFSLYCACQTPSIYHSCHSLLRFTGTHLKACRHCGDETLVTWETVLQLQDPCSILHDSSHPSCSSVLQQNTEFLLSQLLQY